MKLLKNLFKGKPKVKPITVSSSHGDYCPKCKEDGMLFYYSSFVETAYESFYLCENCYTRFNDQEYSHLMKIDQRKQKLDKINQNDN